MVKNLEFRQAIFWGYRYSNIENEHVELDICSWRQFKVYSKLYDLLMDIKKPKLHH